MDRKTVGFIGLIALLALALASCYTLAPPGHADAPTVQPVTITAGPAQIAVKFAQITSQTPTPYLMSTAILGVFSDGSVQIITETVTPWPTWTPSPTDTEVPTVEPTHTPTPTPPVEPSPTPEDARTPSPTPPPTWTPSPTVTNTPAVGGCWGRVTATTLNVREKPMGNWREAAILGQVHFGEQYTFTAKLYNEFWWWKIEWYGDDGTSTGTPAWVSVNWIKPGDTADCSGLEDVTPPETASDMILAWFSMPNGNVGEQVEFVVNAAQQNIVGGTHVYANVSICLQVMDAGGVCSFRHGNPDCPENIFQGDPRAVARDFMRHDSAYANGVFQYERYKGLIYLDPLNECNWGDTVEEYAWWASFFDEYITRAQAQNWPPLMLPSLGPGYGNYLMFATWADQLQLLYDTGGMFAMHTYNPVDTWLCPENEWLADRHVHNYAIMQDIGIDARIALTEVGQGWGNTPPNVDDMACWTDRTAQLPYVDFVAYWYNGSTPHLTWPLSNWSGKALELLRAVAAAHLVTRDGVGG